MFQLPLRRLVPHILAGLLAFNSAATGAPAGEQKRVALIIGNSAYQGQLALANPRNDARLFTEALKKVSPKFEIETVTDLKAGDRDAVLARLTRAAEHASIALFYYAGHALQANDDNYLLPVDMPEHPSRLDDLGALRLSNVLSSMNAVTRAKLVFLDACRNNPFKSQEEARVLPAGRAVRGLGVMSLVRDGLASPDASAFGTGDIFIAYATAPGSVAQDGADANSPFTKALARYLPKQGQEIRKMQTLVANEVKKETGNKELYDKPQAPWFSASLTADLYLWPRPPGQAQAGAGGGASGGVPQAVAPAAAHPKASLSASHALPPGLGGGAGLGGL
jgi:uncharacterized caspase-like protein